MPVTEAQAEQIMVALEAQVKGLMIADGAKYWYTCDLYGRPPNWQNVDLNHFQKVDDEGQEIATIVLARHGHEQLEENPVQALDNMMDVHLVVATRYEPTSENIFEQDPLEQTVQNRAIRDVLKAVFQDVTLGGTADPGGGPADNAQVTDIDRVSHSVEGWAVAELSLRVRYGPSAENP